jgi:hypothetical protein
MCVYENESRNRVIQVTFPATCFFLVLVSWSTLGVTGNQIPKLPSFNLEQLKREAPVNRELCPITEPEASQPGCGKSKNQDSDKRFGDYVEKGAVGIVWPHFNGVAEPKSFVDIPPPKPTRKDEVIERQVA